MIKSFRTEGCSFGRRVHNGNGWLDFMTTVDNVGHDVTLSKIFGCTKYTLFIDF